MRRLLTLALALLAVAAAAPPSSSSPAHPCVQKDELWFRASDGTRLVGHRFGGKRPGARNAVVLVHMSEGDLCSWEPFARSLAGTGLFVLAIDLRGHGFSDGARDHRRAADDLAAAVRAVRGLGARTVVVGGASLGGIAALVASPSLRPAVQGVVAVSPPARIEGTLNALPAVRKLRVPTLYVVARDDVNPPYDFAADARTLHSATATREKKLTVFPGSLHGTFLVDGSARVRALLTRFLRDPAATVP